MALSADEPEASELIRQGSVLLSGVYAWAATVLYPVLHRGVGWAPRVVAALAVVSLVTGCVLSGRKIPLSRAIALHGFIGLCAVAWVLLGGRLGVDRLEPAHAVLGATGWMLFAFSWGVPREPTRVPEDDPGVLPGEPLAPKGELPKGATLVLAVAIVSASLPLVAAWRITRPYHALFGHAVAVVAAVGIVSIGAEIAVRRGRWTAPEPPWRRVSGAAASLALLALLLFAGFVGLVVR